MKSLIIFSTFLFLGFVAQAQNTESHRASKKGVALTFAQLEEKLGSYFASLGSSKPVVFEGELDDVGGECTVSIAKQEDQSLLITLAGEGHLSLSFKVGADDQIRFKEKVSSDDSFWNEYRTGMFGSYALTILHVDDAYDTVSVQVGSTNLTCGAYY